MGFSGFQITLSKTFCHVSSINILEICQKNGQANINKQFIRRQMHNLHYDKENWMVLLHLWILMKLVWKIKLEQKEAFASFQKISEHIIQPITV